MDKDLQLELYRRMFLVRRFEEAVAELYLRGLIPGLAHTSPGQEAVAVGVCAVLRKDDYITSTHRGHGHFLAKGGRPDLLMAELMGKEAGSNRGRGGSMHIADLSLGMLGANGIVGGGFGIAVGAGWSARLRKSGQVCVCFFGDGAVNQGSFAESLNLAALWKLPVVFVCENNLYGEFTAGSKVAAGERLGARAEVYGVRATEMYGQEVLAVHETMASVVEMVRSGHGPEFVEFKTYRYAGHHVGDPGKAYRPQEEVEDWKTNRDPIKLLRTRLLAEGSYGVEGIDALEAAVQSEVDRAVEFAKAAPFPDAREVGLYVYPDA